MRSRWFHVPRLHTAVDSHEKKATWLELFYDLIFVAAFIQLGNGLSAHVTLNGFAGFAGLFVLLWTAWTGFTYYVNRFTVDDFAHRLLVFVQMFAVGGMAVTAPRVLDGDPQYFAFSYAVAQGMVALLYWRSHRQVPAARDYCTYWGRVFGAGAVLWALSGFLPTPACYGLWAVGLGIVLASPFSRHSRELNDRYPIDEEHMSERYGLLTMIVLGESFVKVLGTLTGEGAAWYAPLQAMSTLLITYCIWWIYFDDVAGSRIRGRRFSPVIWLYAHIPLQLGVTAAGVAIKKAVHFDLSAPAPDAYRWLLCGTLGLTLLSVAVVDSVTERRQAELSDRARVNVRSASAVIVLMLAPAGGGMSAGVFVALIAAVMVGQVVFDMMMAPLEESAEDAEAQTIADAVRQRAAGEASPAPRKPRRDVGEAVRKGVPSELRSDIYFYFMDGSWKRFFTALGFLYVMINVFFAALYVIVPGSISSTDPTSFADAFFFSVQTLSTIGYGGMSPETTYGDIIVTIEAAVGLLTVALATGVTFAKASRPQANTLFSEPLLVAERHGKPVLTFRVGNARGNDIVDARITVTVLKDELTPEGEHMRRLHDVKLMRDHSPMFVLTWSVIHEIDDDSPLADVDWRNPDENLRFVVVNLIGHDGTYGQTVYARHVYHCEDIRTGERFVDVISELPDGRLMVDYSRFHDTEPIGAPATA